MAGKVLIIGGAASDRIVLKARLSGARYEVEGAACPAAALGAAAAAPPAAILVLLEEGAEAAVAALRAATGPEGCPIIVLAHRPAEPALRLRLLAAGACDLMVAPAAPLLLARLRNLIRHRALLADLAAQTAPMRELGFAEAPAGAPAPQPTVAILADNAEAALRLRRDLAPHLPARLAAATAETALSPAGGDGRGRPAEVYLLVQGAEGTPPPESDAMLRLLTETGARGTGDEPAFCLLRPRGQDPRDVLAYDLGAADLIDAEAGPAEIALRLTRVLARKRAADGLRASVRDGLRLAVTDPLTGLYNRRYAVGRLAAIAQAAQRLRQGFAVMVVDLDRFKAVNDNWGHAAGDAVLVGVAERLKAHLRPADLLARVGGEEFVVALPCVSLPEAQGVAERMCRAVEAAPFELPQGGALRITASIGLAYADALTAPPDEPVQAVVDRADRALMQAKSGGRNQVTVWQVAA